MTKLSSFANALIAAQLIDETTLLNIIDLLNSESLLYHLAKNNIVSSQKLAALASKLFCLPIFNLKNITLDQIPLDCLPINIITTIKVIPIKKHHTHVDIAIADPGDISAIDTIKFQVGKPINLFVAEFQQIELLIGKLVRQFNTQSLKSLDHEKVPFDLDELMMAGSDDEPLVRFVNHTINEAMQNNASDIHFEIYKQHCRVRFRQDGLLYKITEPSKNIAHRLSARLKIMARLDITEHRIPQDGRCQFLANNKTVDIRMSTCPTLYGEKIVLRLLNNEQKIRQLDELDFTQQQYADFYQAINQPQGLIIVTGPTSSGKTATLYAALHYLNVETKNILTVEDPVEINLPNVNQTNINLKTNFTFARALRTFLRQDPDIIMVGEIRDFETAEIAIKAAQTGHLVLTTLHTNNALQAITRLQNIGIATHDILSSLTLVTAQRLARRLCPYCKTESVNLKNDFNISENIILYDAVGCEKCLKGYLGRFAIHETLPTSSSSQAQLIQTPNNFISIQDAAINTVKTGVTSLAEIKRVIQF